ncbi:hypothetical protein [Nonomuraea sp. NPDC050310]|uniref:hypothetical protein n=1 Tax=unclassified Nonomuraea TaxID=2593643 RepID=UPI0033E9F26A
MRRTLGTLLGVSLIAAPLAVFTPAAQAEAASGRPPYSKFKISVKYDTQTKRGGKITYLLKAKNLGPYYANWYWVGAKVPKGVEPRLTWTGPKSSKCTWEGEWFWCWGPYALDVGDTDWLQFQLKLKKTTKGVATARVGVLSFDVPNGAENVDKEELDRIGESFDRHYDLKTTHTKIIWPRPNRPQQNWTPPVTKSWNPPTTKTEENKKKGT